jgi:beta-1,4-mannosyl-glycoprotein beta-1,4-N-acetylglucosaminyltransferase
MRAMLPPPILRRFFSQQLFAERAEPDAIPAGLPEAVRERCDEAWRSGDVDVYLESARWLMRNDLLHAGDAKRLAQKLNELGRHADAAAVLTDPRYAKPDRPHYWAALAVARAGQGRLDEANQAWVRANAAGGEPGKSDAAFGEALRLASQQAAEPATWDEARALAEAWVVLGVPRRAAEVLRLAIETSLPDGDDERLEALRLAQQILRLSEPGPAAEFMDGFRPGLERLGLADHPGARLCEALALGRAGEDEAAVPILAPLAAHLKDAENRGAEDARIDLAGAIGRLVLLQARPSLRPSARPKVIDMFPINDELLLLKIKLEEMHRWVDRFIVVESTFTFRGEPKPLHFDRAKADFAEFADKIVHVVVDEVPAWATTPWTREFYQRDRGLHALRGLCGEDDYVLVTDVDEIVDHRAIGALTTPFASLAMPTYSYFFNLEVMRVPQARWAGVLKARYLQKIGPSYAKIGFPQYVKGWCVEDAGWHFSSVRDVEGLVSKFNSYSNTQWSGARREDFEQALARIRAEGGAPGCVRREIDESFPGYIREHADELSHLIL